MLLYRYKETKRNAETARKSAAAVRKGEMTVKEVVIAQTEKEISVTLAGEIDSSNADVFYETVQSAFAACPKDVHFYCEKLNFIDSTTLGAFVKLLKHIRSEGKNMQLSGLQPKIWKLFTICALDRIMEIDA